MYIYGIEKITEENKALYESLYDTYFHEKVESIREFVGANRLGYYINAKEDNQIIGAMGILLPQGEVGEGEFYRNLNYYSFFHLVVHVDHTGQGIATGIIRMAVKFLIEMGAIKIRNHKRENIIPHTVFTDMGFELVSFNDEEPEYKWNYELDVSKADMTKLNEIWSEYVS